jgi:hypothetical protein
MSDDSKKRRGGANGRRYSPEPERHDGNPITLWRAVIQQAVIDATLPLRGPAYERLARQSAREWFKLHNVDFVTTCDLAGLDPVRVRNYVLPLIEEAKKNDLPVAKRERKPRKRRLYTVNGRTLTITQWAQELGISKTTIYERIDRGWTIEAALTTPARQQPTSDNDPGVVNNFAEAVPDQCSPSVQETPELEIS